MTKNKEADLRGIGFDSKTNDYFADNQRAFSVSDYSNDLESVQAIIERMMRPGKVIRCYRCFACKRHFPASRLSTALVLCRECLNSTRAKGRSARQNVIDRITNDFRTFLRGPLEIR